MLESAAGEAIEGDRDDPPRRQRFPPGRTLRAPATRAARSLASETRFRDQTSELPRQSARSATAMLAVDPTWSSKPSSS
jgi:hypothetical protein